MIRIDQSQDDDPGAMSARETLRRSTDDAARQRQSLGDLGGMRIFLYGYVTSRCTTILAQGQKQ